jgi:hypothetical protein
MVTRRMIIYGGRFERRRKAIVRRYTPKFFNILKRQYLSFIKAVNAYGLPYARANMDNIINPGEMVVFLKKYYRMCAYIESNATLKNVRSGFKIKRVGSANLSIGFDDLAPVIDDYFELYKWNKSGFPISETTKKDITRYLLDKVDGGMSLKEALQDFKKIAIDSPAALSYRRAVKIANTESVRGMNFGSMIGAYMSGVDLEKIWVTMHDERVRPTADFPGPYSHRDLEGRVSDLMKPYYNGERINYPGDPEASPANIINCRCCLIYREKKKPKPIDYARSLLNFMTDFFIGFVLGQINARIYESERV